MYLSRQHAACDKLSLELEFCQSAVDFVQALERIVPVFGLCFRLLLGCGLGLLVAVVVIRYRCLCLLLLGLLLLRRWLGPFPLVRRFLLFVLWLFSTRVQLDTSVHAAYSVVRTAANTLAGPGCCCSSCCSSCASSRCTVRPAAASSASSCCSLCCLLFNLFDMLAVDRCSSDDATVYERA